jgi:hypothetical protein
MPRNLFAGLVGAILVIILLGFQAVSEWSVVDTVLNGLRSKGPVGAFLGGLLVSPIVPLVLAMAAIGFAYEGFRELKNRRNEAPAPPRVEASVRDSGNSIATGGTSTATGGSATVNLVMGNRPSPPPLVNAPNLLVTRIYRSAIYFKHSTIWSRFDSGSAQQMLTQAIFAEVKNARDESRAVGEALGVRAELVVETALDTGEYTPLPWLETEFNTVNFRFGDTHFVLLAANLDRTGSVGDWRIFLNHKGFSDATPGVLKMDGSHLWISGSEKKVKLNLLHIASGTVICSVEGSYQLKKGRLEIMFP